MLLLTALAAIVAQTWRGSRRRVALNRALHEIRRPLQAMALAAPPQGATGIQPGTVWQAISAVGELDRHLNGPDDEPPRHDPVAARLMAGACVSRLRVTADLAGSRISMRWAGPEAFVRGDGPALAGAIENLLLNAIEHGGPEVTLNAVVTASHLRLEVIDSGRGPADRGSRGRGSHSARHGHGLVVARRAAENHGGRLEKDLSETGSKVTLVLPVDRSAPSATATLRAAC
ncbi:MAG TPA: ATP-binding protein [Solirubrobacterales bacterium]|nr:ATP-binding protein [Solirubrobacterales bacterium]